MRRAMQGGDGSPAPEGRTARLLRLALAAAALAGCAESRAGETVSEAAFSGGESSVEALGRGVVRALLQADTAALADLRVTRNEHDRLLWPEFPASQQEPPVPVDWAWENLEMRNGGAVFELLHRYSGGEVEFESAECRGATQSFETFVIHDDCYVLLRDAGGKRLRDQPFRSVVVRDGIHKVIRYYK